MPCVFNENSVVYLQFSFSYKNFLQLPKNISHIFLLNRIVKHAIFPIVVNGWKKSNPEIRSSSSESVFQNTSPNFLRPTARMMVALIVT